MARKPAPPAPPPPPVALLAATLTAACTVLAQDRTAMSGTYATTGAPTCVWFAQVGGGGLCDAQFCEAYSAEYQRCTLAPADATDEQLETSDSCLLQYQEGENVFAEDRVCNSNRLAMWPSSCQPPSADAAAHLANHSRRGLEHCVGRSEAECETSEVVPCGAAPRACARRQHTPRVSDPARACATTLAR